MSDERLVRNISDTALWVAYYRALESERPDAVFRDPYARALAGERGAGIARSIPLLKKHSWSMVSRTFLFDTYVADEVRAGADMIVNLAAGLDTRPYRMGLPASLRWIEIDLPGILEYKEEILRDARPACALERIPLDLSDPAARRPVLSRLAASARRVVVLTEGLLVYLDAEQVCALGRDLASLQAVHTWIVDLSSPGLLEMMRKQGGGIVEAAGAPFKFGPPEGPAFFTSCGWTPATVGSMLHTGAKLKRLPLLLRLFAMLPDTHPGPRSRRPWSAVVRLLKRG